MVRSAVSCSPRPRLKFRLAEQPVSQHERQCGGDDGQRKGYIGGSHAGDAHALSDENLVGNIIKIVHHQRQGCGNGILADQMADGLGGQRIGRRRHRAGCFGIGICHEKYLPTLHIEEIKVSHRHFLLPSRLDCWLRNCTGLACARGLYRQ